MDPILTSAAVVVVAEAVDEAAAAGTIGTILAEGAGEEAGEVTATQAIVPIATAIVRHPAAEIKVAEVHHNKPNNSLQVIKDQRTNLTQQRRSNHQQKMEKVAVQVNSKSVPLGRVRR